MKRNFTLQEIVSRASFYGTYKLIAFYLSEMSESRTEEFKSKVNDIFNDHKENATVKKIIENKSGYLFV